ncbi:MAG TPA: CBS domain-containing protein [Methanoregulaceae archaeon]|nr:CBS domain-containing protein [Methanoregulaceae archaeon]HOV68118.1 CBS domain-containing protein [Methanoregulaceae archaeon]HQJ87062.1 CBS domain-containing protein [Methanoregulaceae archaeon]
MDGSLRIGRLFGIPIELHFTFLLVIPLFAWIIGTQIGLTLNLLGTIFGIAIDPGLILSGPMPFLLGGLVSLGLFAGVLLHEIAHSLVALRWGMRINAITLYLFGGVSQMEEVTPDPRIELPMALVGPLTSLAIGILCSGLVYVVDGAVTDRPLAGAIIFTLAYLGLLNVILFAFNLIPAFPMDGGRVLRAYLARRMPLPRATRIAASVGKGFAVVFGVLGLLALNPILVIIAFFIYIGASQESTAIRYTFLLRDVTLGQIMSREVQTVEPSTPVRTVLEQMYATKHLGFPVVDRGALVGMITLDDIHGTNPIDRDALLVRDVMTRGALSLPPEAPVFHALRVMSEKNIGRIPVVRDGELLGIVTRTDIMKVIELREL